MIYIGNGKIECTLLTIEKFIFLNFKIGAWRQWYLLRSEFSYRFVMTVKIFKVSLEWGLSFAYNFYGLKRILLHGVNYVLMGTKN